MFELMQNPVDCRCYALFFRLQTEFLGMIKRSPVSSYYRQILKLLLSGVKIRIDTRLKGSNFPIRYSLIYFLP